MQSQVTTVPGVVLVKAWVPLLHGNDEVKALGQPSLDVNDALQAGIELSLLEEDSLGSASTCPSFGIQLGRVLNRVQT